MVQSVPLPEGCEDLTIADIGDTDIEEFHFSSTKDKKLTTENEVNPELLHVNSAVFEEGSMPKAIFSSKPVFQNKLNDVKPANIQFVS